MFQWFFVNYHVYKSPLPWAIKLPLDTNILKLAADLKATSVSTCMLQMTFLESAAFNFHSWFREEWHKGRDQRIQWKGTWAKVYKFKFRCNCQFCSRTTPGDNIHCPPNQNSHVPWHVYTHRAVVAGCSSGPGLIISHRNFNYSPWWVMGEILEQDRIVSESVAPPVESICWKGHSVPAAHLHFPAGYHSMKPA